MSGNMADDLNNLLPNLLKFLKDLLYNETLSKEYMSQCSSFIEKLETVIKTPSLGRKYFHPRNEGQNIDNLPKSNSVEEFLRQQRDIARKGTIWKNEEQRPKLKSDESQNEKKENLPTTEKNNSAIYERIISVSTSEDHPAVTEKKTANNKRKSNADESSIKEPPPVPERKGRSTSAFNNIAKSPVIKRAKSDHKEVVLVHDLKTPLYSGLLRNVRLNIKQWCVIKKQKLYLFNDLMQPADFIANLQEYEVFKDPQETNTFRISRIGELSLVLAAVDDEQYELWHYAFRRAKVLADTMFSSSNSINDLPDYVSPEAIEDVVEDFPYEKPDQLGIIPREELTSPEGIYVSMDGNLPSPSRSSLSRCTYEVMDNLVPTLPMRSPTLSRDFLEDSPPPLPKKKSSSGRYEGSDFYSSMPLPPTPDESPEVTRSRGATLDDENSSLSASESVELTNMDSDNESTLTLDQTASQQTNSWPRKKIKGRKEKEVEFFRDLSAIFCGILYQRRMLAVWQKRFCKVKDHCLICYRSVEATEPAVTLELPGYEIDRAEEAWKSHAFKMTKNTSDIWYFAAETRQDLVKWLNILVKETKKDKPNVVEEGLDFPDKTASIVSSKKSYTASVESLDDGMTSSPGHGEFTDSSDFDADNESIGSDLALDEIPPQPRLKMGRFTQVKNNHKKRRRAATLNDPHADMQGFLFCKYKSNWVKRWCSVKNAKLMIYKRPSNDLPELVVLLVYAALRVPTNEDLTGQYFFKLRYEGTKCVMLRTKHKRDWKQWISAIGKDVGSRSEEEFKYVNVPPRRSGDRPSTEYPTYDNNNEGQGVNPVAEEKRVISTSSQVSLPPRALVQHGTDELPERSPSEIKDSIHHGNLTELQNFHQSSRHFQRFVVLTKDKWLKIYDNADSPSPVAWFYGLNVEVIEESGADPSILRLQVELSTSELIFKCSDHMEYQAWKKAFDKLHYEDISEVSTPLGDEISDTPEKLFRKRSNSIDNKDKSEPVLLSHSRTLPHMGKNKRRAREMKSNPRTLPNENLNEALPPRKSFSALLRSFTIDTFGRKAKNKSYELQKDESALLKETQNGVLDELIISEKGEEVILERYGRISGKVFYVYENENDKKPLVKIPLRNAAIEDSADIENNLFQFKITEMDTGKEFSYLLENETDLEIWVEALFGVDQLHKSLENSPAVSKQDLSYSPAVPLRNSNELEPNKSLPSLPGNKTNIASPLLNETEEQEQSCSPALSPRKMSPHETVKRPPSLPGNKTEFVLEPARNGVEVHEQKTDKTPQSLPLKNGSVSSMSSVLTVSQSTLSETEGRVSPGKRRLRTLTEDTEIHSHVMFEYIDYPKSKRKKWLVLKTSTIEIYNNEQDKNPERVLKLDEYALLNEDNKRKKYTIQLKHANSGNVLLFHTPNFQVYDLWVTELQDILKEGRSRGRSKTSVVLRQFTTPLTRVKLNENDKRASMVLIEDDVIAIKEYEDSADPSNTMSGILQVVSDSGKERERHCWIKNGLLYIAKNNRTDKPLKVIDLSTVVILDESDTSVQRYSFRLNYALNEKQSSILLRAQDSKSADRWMVAVSMGILFHRLKNSKKSFAEEDEVDPSDFDFVSLAGSSVSQVKDIRKRSSNNPLKLGVDIKRELARKAQQGEAHLISVSKALSSEFPSPKSSPHPSRKSDSVEQVPDEVDGKSVTDKDLQKLSDSALPTTSDSNPRLSLIPDNEDSVFKEGEQTNEEPLLENIPERENADETFKNVKGILRQQESIRRAILKRQQSDRGESEKKVPPKVKPKPSTQKKVLTESFKVKLVENLEELSMTEIQQYKQRIEGEKSSLLRCIKKMSVIVTEAKTNLKRSRSMREDSTRSEKELDVATSDFKSLKERFNKVERELKKIDTLITRKVAQSISSRRKSGATVWYSGGSLPQMADTTSPVKISSNLHDDGYNSEPVLDEGYHRRNSERDSVIV